MGKSIFNMLGVLLMVAILFIMIRAECARGAQSVLCEGEDFVASHNIDGYEIAAHYCPSASGDWAVDGVDRAEEWVEMLLVLPESPCWSAGLAMQTFQNQVSHLKLSLFPESGGDAAAVVEFHFTGVGIGCTFPYHEATGEEHFCILPGNYRARIELITGEWSRIDVLILRDEDSAARSMSWSVAKTIYNSDRNR